MPPPVDPSAFGWLTTEKAAALVTLIAAFAAYWVGIRKRDKSEGAVSAGASMTRTNELLEEILGVLRGIGRQMADRAEVDHGVHVQIRDEIRLMRADVRGEDRQPGDTLPPAPRRRQPRRSVD